MRPRAPINTPRKVKMARAHLGLDRTALAAALRLGGTAGRNTVRGWETGATIPGPVQIALEHLVKEKA